MMKQANILRYALLFLGTVSIAACSAVELEITYPDLAGTEWTLEAFEVDGDGEPVERTYTLRFNKESELASQAYCNECHGEYKLGGKDSISMSLGCTRQLCPRSSDFQVAVNRADRYEVQSDRLRIYSADYSNEESVLHFRRGVEE